jgi:hypothetical protein
MDNQRNSVSVLNEYCQKNKLQTPVYEIVKMEGQSHSPEITVLLKVNGLKDISSTAITKKIAANKCASEAIDIINKVKYAQHDDEMPPYKYRIVEFLSEEETNFGENLKSLWHDKLDSLELVIKRSNGVNIEFKSKYLQIKKHDDSS